MIKLSGADLWSAIDHSFTLDDEFRYNTAQVSGMAVVADLSKKPYERVQSIDIVGANGAKTALKKDQIYYVVVPSYLADGKDGFAMLKVMYSPSIFESRSIATDTPCDTSRNKFPSTSTVLPSVSLLTRTCIVR